MTDRLPAGTADGTRPPATRGLTSRTRSSRSSIPAAGSASSCATPTWSATAQRDHGRGPGGAGRRRRRGDGPGPRGRDREPSTRTSSRPMSATPASSASRASWRSRSSTTRRRPAPRSGTSSWLRPGVETDADGEPLPAAAPGGDGLPPRPRRVSRWRAARLPRGAPAPLRIRARAHPSPDPDRPARGRRQPASVAALLGLACRRRRHGPPPRPRSWASASATGSGWAPASTRTGSRSAAGRRWASASPRSGRSPRWPQAGNPRPRLFRLPDDEALINRMGFNNAGAAALARNVMLARRHLPAGFVVGVNIGRGAATPADAGRPTTTSPRTASSPRSPTTSPSTSARPNTPGLRDLQAAGPAARAAGRAARRPASMNRPAVRCSSSWPRT